MIILLLILKNYKRFSLNNISYFKYEPKKKIQLILGTNSSGKSSLLKELSPLPASHKDFFDNGFKKIKIKHNDVIYELSNNFDYKNFKYYIQEGGKELNPGGGLTTYKSIVNSLFGLTTDIHDLFIGYNKFHEMSMLERKEWFTRISYNDYTYAIKYYNKIKEQYRDIQGVIKFNKARLVQESTLLLNEKEYLKQKEEVKDSKYLIDVLLNSRINNNVPSDNNSKILDDKISEVSLDIIENTNKIDILFDNPNFNKFNLDKNLIDAKIEFNRKEDISERTFQEIVATDNSIEIIKGKKGDSLEEINDYEKELHSLISKETNYILHNLKFDNNTQALLELNYIRVIISDIFSGVIRDKIVSMSREEYDELTTKHNNLKNNIIFLDDKHINLLKIKQNYIHHKKHNEIDCPKCQHKWIRGFSEKDFIENNKNITKVFNSLEKDKKTLVDLDEILIEEEKYKKILRKYNNIVHERKSLLPFWELVSTNNILNTNPKMINSLLDEVIEDLNIQIKIDKYELELLESLEIKKLINKGNVTDVEKLKHSRTELQKKLFSEQTTLHKISDDIRNMNNIKKLFSEVTVSGKELRSMVDESNSNILNKINNKKNAFLNEQVQILKSRILYLESNLNDVETNKAFVAKTTALLNELEVTSKIYKLIIKELSPTEGLVAKGLSTFMNDFILDMNSFIERVWSYPLELVPTEIDEDDEIDLNFKLTVKVNNNVSIPDINKASSAVKEIIDLAFRVTSMSYMSLSNYPLYLDELGSSFDKEHRQKIRTLIYNLSQFSDFSQFFVVSHYEEMHGSFKDSDILILSEENIKISKSSVFNECVTIK